MGKKVLFSAIQPTGVVTLGNFLGAITNWKKLMDSGYDCIFSIADLHSLTVKQDPSRFPENVYELAAFYLACGLDIKKCIFFIQSHVHEHSELTWILNTITTPGELQRMTQFKDKSKSHADNINMGLMDYPVLMASDILLYRTELVPVGADQKQHLELARNLAERFNSRFSYTFVVPEPYIAEYGSKIMSLQNPEKKMSKSDSNVNAFISLNDDKDTIIRKFKKSVTDSGSEIKYSPEKQGISNLLTIYSVIKGKSIKESEKDFEGQGYGTFKLAVAEAVSDVVVPIQNEKNRIMKDMTYLKQVLSEGAAKASERASQMLSSVYSKVGLTGKQIWA